jgi:hypothetical protein
MNPVESRLLSQLAEVFNGDVVLPRPIEQIENGKLILLATNLKVKQPYVEKTVGIC